MFLGDLIVHGKADEKDKQLQERDFLISCHFKEKEIYDVEFDKLVQKEQKLTSCNNNKGSIRININN